MFPSLSPIFVFLTGENKNLGSKLVTLLILTYSFFFPNPLEAKTNMCQAQQEDHLSCPSLPYKLLIRYHHCLVLPHYFYFFLYKQNCHPLPPRVTAITIVSRRGCWEVLGLTCVTKFQIFFFKGFLIKPKIFQYLLLLLQNSNITTTIFMTSITTTKFTLPSLSFCQLPYCYLL